MSYDNDAAAAFYEDPENRRPAGPPRARKGQGQRLSGHLPIRFEPGMLDTVRRIAEQDGMTAGGWVRSVVERAVEERLKPQYSLLTTRCRVVTHESRVHDLADWAPFSSAGVAPVA